MSYTQITRAAFEQLSIFVWNPQPEILWPGIETRPPDQGMWLEPDIFPNEIENVAWNNESCVEMRGFFQILVHYRPGHGQKEPTILADALIAHFPKGFALGPVRVIKRGWQAAQVVEGDDLYIPITIPYQGLT